MTSKAELAERHVDSVVGMPHNHKLGSNRRAVATGYYSGFLAGYDAAASQILDWLRSEDVPGRYFAGSGGHWADVLETKLKGGGG